ncbi:MAG: MazG nucleotide pyrophosphohydrolase domain-containing protein [Candidatus Helarchaeota archaeon]
MKIKDFQKLMYDLYFERDKKRGISKTFMWLVEEVGELSRAINKIDINKDFSNISEEFADVFAWLCSLANIIGIDLQESSIKKYNQVCPKCKNKPCSCEFK